ALLAHGAALVMAGPGTADRERRWAGDLDGGGDRRARRGCEQQRSAERAGDGAQPTNTSHVSSRGKRRTTADVLSPRRSRAKPRATSTDGPFNTPVVRRATVVCAYVAPKPRTRV